MQLVFNEISVSTKKLNISEANSLFSSFLQIYSEAIKLNCGISRSILTSIDFNDIEISLDYYIAQWRNSAFVDRDEKRRFLGICDRQNITIPQSDEYVFVQCGNTVGKGLQIAYENHSPLISIPSMIEWKENNLQCTLYDIELEDEKQIFLRNLCCVDSLKVHENWINTTIKKERMKINTSEEFLSRFQEIYPSLVFHRNALAQMKNQINPVNIPTIVEKLFILEEYFSNWDGGKFDCSAFPPRFVSPESSATLSRFASEHTFEWDDSAIIVSYHVRYTGGDVPGRIYIYPDHKQRKCIVCSMHTKLPTVSNPKF